MIHLQLWKPKTLSDLHERYPWKTFERFYPLAKRYGFTDRDEVDKFLKKEVVHDHFLEARATKKPRKPFLPIFSKIPNAFQFDTFFTKSSQWLVFVNINTRKAYAYPMPDKSSKSAIAALEKFHEDVPEVKILESDQDSAYLSKEFLAKINEYGIGYTTVADNNHHVLGIINRFIRTIRDHVEDINDSSLQRFIKVYNDTPHEALHKRSPNEITPELEEEYIKQTDHRYKALKNKMPLIPIGARVRVAFPSSTFEKKRSNFSKVAYIINDIVGNQYQIKALDGSVDNVPWFSVRPIEKGLKIATAKTIKESKRKVVKKILSWDNRKKNYLVQYDDPRKSKQYIPPRNLREGRPAIMSALEKQFWAEHIN